MLMKLKLTLLPQSFTVHQLPKDAEIPVAVLESPFFAITRTSHELSIVTLKSINVASESSETGWACFKVEGPLDFGLVGILAGIASALAEASVPLFAISTFETDYILIKLEQTEAAVKALKSAGYQVTKELK